MTGNAAASPEPGEAARSEVSSNGQKKLDFEGLKLKLPPKVPFRVVRYLRGKEMEPADIAGVLESILGEAQAEQVWALDIDMDRGNELVEQVLAAYDMTAGESQASPTS